MTGRIAGKRTIRRLYGRNVSRSAEKAHGLVGELVREGVAVQPSGPTARLPPIDHTHTTRSVTREDFVGAEGVLWVSSSFEQGQPVCDQHQRRLYARFPDDADQEAPAIRRDVIGP